MLILIHSPHLPSSSPASLHTNSVDIAASTANLIPAEPSSYPTSLDLVPSIHVLSSSPPPLKRSQRTSKPPSYLQLNKCSAITCDKSTHSSSSINSSTPYPVSHYLDSSKLSPSYSHLCSLITNVVEPQSYHEDIKDPKWQEAIAAEISALKSNNTWMLTHLPPNKNSIDANGCTRSIISHHRKV